MNQPLEENAWALGNAVQHRDVLTAMHRNSPSAVSAADRAEANREVRRLQAQRERIHLRNYLGWSCIPAA